MMNVSIIYNLIIGGFIIVGKLYHILTVRLNYNILENVIDFYFGDF